MAKLRIKADDGKTLVIDVTGHDQSEYDELASAANDDYMVQKAKFDDIRNEPGLESGLSVYTKPAGQMTKAGYAGIGNLVAGNDLQQAATDVTKVEAGEKPETTSGKVGEFAGSMFTPEQIAMQAVMGPMIEASGVGPWAAKILQGWGEKAARMAVGVIRKVAKALGSESLPAIAQFLLSPVKIGAQELPAIVAATNDGPAMLKAAEAIKSAAGAALEKINPIVDEGLIKNPGAIDLPHILQNIDKLKLAIQDAAPKLGKAVVRQFEDATDDFLEIVKRETLSDNPELFTALRNFKTILGDLIYKHGEVIPSKAALGDVYAVISKGIDEAAKAVDPVTQALFNEANAVYNKIIPIVQALEGKVVAEGSKGFFSDVSSLGVGMLTGFAHPGLAVPAAITSHLAKNYGPQAIAKGLNTLSPMAPTLIKGAARSVPIIGNAIAQGLEE